MLQTAMVSQNIHGKYKRSGIYCQGGSIHVYISLSFACHSCLMQVTQTVFTVIISEQYVPSCSVSKTNGTLEMQSYTSTHQHYIQVLPYNIRN